MTLAKCLWERMLTFGRIGVLLHESELLELLEQHRDLLNACRDLYAVVRTDDLIPESVSYMRQALAALTRAEKSQ